MTVSTSLRCDRVSFAYGTAARTPVLSEVSFEVRAGEFLSVVGPSGCGKTTLIRLLGGLLQPSSGSIRFSPEPEPRRATLFQEHGLFPWLTVLENVAFGLEAEGVPRGEREAKAGALIDGVGLGEYQRAFPAQLSVGMRQRVSLCRALLVQPDVLLLDEPFSSLDALAKTALQEELARVCQERRFLTIHVTHDIEEAVRMSDRILVLAADGRVIESIEIPTSRPRPFVPGPEDADRAALVWKALASDVRRRLSLPVGP